jgi:RNA polymerase sigma-70 factor (ECF subfamily)
MGAMAEQLVAAGPVAAALSDFPGWMASQQRRIFLLCLRMLGDPDAADTATQDVFLKAYRSFEKQDGEIDDLTRWVTRIAVNTCLDKLRSRRWHFWRKRPNQEDEEVILAMAPSTGPDAEDKLYAQQIGARLQTAMERLSERQRAVFTLRHFEDLSLDEIATLLGLDVGTVKAHLARAIAKMREDLRDLYEARRD